MATILLFRQLETNENVDGRDEPGHDEVKLADSIRAGPLKDD
jgi:hypothetical protein